MIRTPLSRLALGLALIAPASGFAQDADTVLATVGETPITLGHVIAVQENLPDQYRQLPDDVLYKGILDQLVQQAAIAQSLGDTFPLRLQLSLDNERRALLANSVLQEAASSAVTEEKLQEAYDARFANAQPEQEFNASHILVESEEEAQALVSELAEGADFAELAKARSIGPSGPNGGELGWFGRGMMVAPFEAAVDALDAETVSDPVQTQFGWHVIRLNDVRVKEAPSLESLREELSAELEQSAVQEAIASLTADIEVDRAEVELDAALIRDSSLLD